MDCQNDNIYAQMLPLVRVVKTFVVVQFVEVLRYKPEGGGFDSRRG